jgi:hypothetical protein
MDFTLESVRFFDQPNELHGDQDSSARCGAALARCENAARHVENSISVHFTLSASLESGFYMETGLESTPGSVSLRKPGFRIDPLTMLANSSPLDKPNNLAARVRIDADCLHLFEQCRLGLTVRPPGLKRPRQSGLAQTVSDSFNNGDFTACTLTKNGPSTIFALWICLPLTRAGSCV